jgi:hypothetical protein
VGAGKLSSKKTFLSFFPLQGAGAGVAVFVLALFLLHEGRGGVSAEISVV